VFNIRGRIKNLLVTGSAFAIMIVSGLAQASPLETQKLLAERGPREVIWSFDASVSKPSFECPDGSMIEGYGGSFTIGYGRIRDSRWLNGRIHFLAGPFDVARHGQFDADFNGTLLDVEYGSAFPGYDLRGANAPLLSVAAGYMDFNGHNIGDNRKNNGDPNDRHNYYLEQDFRISTSALVVTPAVGWIWAQPARPRGNEPELLTTRAEAAYVKLGALVPLYSHSRVEVTKRDENDALSQSPVKKSSTGHLAGYSFVLSSGVWLGI
jgi:hypothetical protein